MTHSWVGNSGGRNRGHAGRVGTFPLSEPPHRPLSNWVRSSLEDSAESGCESYQESGERRRRARLPDSSPLPTGAHALPGYPLRRSDPRDKVTVSKVVASPKGQPCKLRTSPLPGTSRL